MLLDLLLYSSQSWGYSMQKSQLERGLEKLALDGSRLGNRDTAPVRTKARAAGRVEKRPDKHPVSYALARTVKDVGEGVAKGFAAPFVASDSVPTEKKHAPGFSRKAEKQVNRSARKIDANRMAATARNPSLGNLYRDPRTLRGASAVAGAIPGSIAALKMLGAKPGQLTTGVRAAQAARYAPKQQGGKLLQRIARWRGRGKAGRSVRAKAEWLGLDAAAANALPTATIESEDHFAQNRSNRPPPKPKPRGSGRLARIAKLTSRAKLSAPPM